VGRRRPRRPRPNRRSEPTTTTEKTLVVAAADAGERLDRFLVQKLPHLSRARLQALIEAGHVRLAGGPARASLKLRAAQEVTVAEPEPEPALPQPEDIPLRVLHEDPQLLVLDKPAGLVVHPGAGHAGGTLVNALLHHVKDLSGIGGVLRPGIVHRLDRGTSGLLLVAKDDASHRALQQQFQTRSVEKEYLAIVLGTPARPTGDIEAPIGRDPKTRQKMSTRSTRGRAAHSQYRVVQAFDGAALVRVRIHTGRTHQIRVHLASIGHPVAGDATYGGRRPAASRNAAVREALLALERPALHAARLVFTHPATAARLAFESPLPHDLAALLRTLESTLPTKP